MADQNGHAAPDAATPPPVGRDRELATLRAHLDAALAGRGSLILIGGEAGIGKTALAETLLAEARERGALVLVGRCYDLSETPPYGCVGRFDYPFGLRHRFALTRGGATLRQRVTHGWRAGAA